MSNQAATFVILLALMGAGDVVASLRMQVAGEARLADAHVHLSGSGGDGIERLVAANITAVRDCGGDFGVLAKWRDEIASGRRRGPRLFLAGPLIDGPKEGAKWRVTVRTVAEAERAVDDLAALGVDFIKTHNALSQETFLAVVRRANKRGLRVAAHLPRGVPAWVAAEAGVGSIEHAAESILASPIYAGFADDAAAAVQWWASPAGDAAIRRLAQTGVTVVPTLVRYEATIQLPDSRAQRDARAALLPQLIALMGRLHRAGVPLLAGSDLDEVQGADAASGPAREVQLLEAAGLTHEAAMAAASPEALVRWFNR